MEIFNYSFIIRGLEAGIMIAVIAPLIGIFLVLRRYSLIADTLSHVSLAGVAVGFLLNINPLLTAIIASVVSSVMIEKLRMSKKIFGESALAIFLSGSLSVAVILLNFSRGFTSNIFNYLFGSIVTVKQAELDLIFLLGLFVLTMVVLFFKELVYTTVDEEAARVSGIGVNKVNSLLIVLSSLTVAFSIPVIGVLLISALMVIPVVTALQFKTGFLKTIVLAQVIALVSVVGGIFLSFYFNLAAGGTIVLFTLVFFILTYLFRRGL